MKNKKALLLLPLVASLSCGNVYSYETHDKFIAGACAAAAALVGIAGTAAFVDWCFSETDDQLIGRVSSECQIIVSQYKQSMDYFLQQAGVGLYSPHRPIQYIPETVLFEFATFVWNSGSSQSAYRSELFSAKYKLQGYVKDLSKRIYSYQGKYTSYEEQKKLSIMRNLLQSVEQLLVDITLFADCLECHNSYFTLYDCVGKTRNRYAAQIAILESGRYSIHAEIKQSILSYDSSQYAFRNFVKGIESDISNLDFSLRNLAYNYEAGQRYAHQFLHQLITIKNIVVTDSRYQEELYQWEQARLEQQRIRILEEQARMERDRIRIERERNRLMEKQIQLERQKIYAQPVMVPVPCVEEVSIIVSF